jgi:hypothetical protein
MATDLSPADLALLIRAAKTAGLDPSKLQPVNPWAKEGAVAFGLQTAVSDLDPVAAERLQNDAGVRLSLGAVAALEGLTEWTPELEGELQAKRPETYRRLHAEAVEAAADQAFGPWRQQQAEALELARQFGYNVDALAARGHSLAARMASEHLERERQQATQQRQQDLDWYGRAATGR